MRALVLMFCALGCAPTKGPEAQPDAVVLETPVKRSSSCQRACQRMLELHCIDATVTPDGRSCDDVFCSITGHWNFACMERANSCEELNRCNP